jgi:hypothetical protein
VACEVGEGIAVKAAVAIEAERRREAEAATKDFAETMIVGSQCWRPWPDGLVESRLGRYSTMKSVSIGWCGSMSFAGIDDDVDDVFFWPTSDDDDADGWRRYAQGVWWIHDADVCSSDQDAFGRCFEVDVSRNTGFLGCPRGPAKGCWACLLYLFCTSWESRSDKERGLRSNKSECVPGDDDEGGDDDEDDGGDEDGDWDWDDGIEGEDGGREWGKIDEKREPNWG